MAEKILVLSVDRDDDIGSKTKSRGPIVGKDNVLKAATDLGLADPEDSDFNALFQTVKVYDEIKKSHEAEVAAITGNRNVGIQSDREIDSQLNKILANFKADYVIFVTDGTEDEHVMPIIQSRVPILSVKRVIVKQSEQLESTYYKIKDFIQESADNPRMARLFFGIPAIVLLLFAAFGVEGFRVILAVVGAYFFIRGFRLEGYVYNAIDELKTSLTRRRFAFFTYIVGIAFAMLATYRGYTYMQEWLTFGPFETLSSYVSASVYFYFLSAAMIWIGRNLAIKKRRGRKIMSVLIFGFAISIVVYNASELILRPEISILNFILSIFIGFGLIFTALMIEWKT
jgi:putative membrane protein